MSLDEARTWTAASLGVNARAADSDAPGRRVGGHFHTDGDTVGCVGRQAIDDSLEEHEEIGAPVDSGDEPGGARLQRRRDAAVIGRQVVGLRVSGRIVGKAGAKPLWPAIEVVGERQRLGRLGRIARATAADGGEQRIVPPW